jgi:HAD superfamily hydrolase (TIGR01549 family)
MADTAIFDVDGTLVDSNYHHVVAWHRAFRGAGVDVPLWTIHRAVGMGGDMLVAHVAGDDVESEHGDDIRASWESAFDEIINEVSAFEGASALLDAVRDRGFTVVLASSGKKKHIDRFLDAVGDTSAADGVLTADDVDRSKPEPDIVHRAMDEVSGRNGVLIGDSIWDCAAGRRAGTPTIALKTGGFSEAELRAAGAVAVFDSLVELRRRLDETLLAKPSEPSS